ncbi:MAG: AAA family ATPase, partial [Desulfobacteraceae bacterium]|nr:AAA family ATPase [Desulfobacteraceae bacterium]MBC2753917.1 AAA family ATPase [Desulfobacteraceae bacterium]
MKCPKCQAENQEARKFCRECGAKLLLLCPQCNSENIPGDKFCGECGHSLKEPTKPPDYSEPQSYTPKFLADKILTSRSSIEGERKLVTVLFADVAGFTSMSEKLDPEQVHQIMDGCFKVLMDEIHKFEGTINQFTGDGVMALFGAPVAHEDHAQRACYASLSIQKAIEKYGEKLKNERGIDFKMRIGLNSGPVIVASIGDDLRMDYTAVGDTTNLAARMESTAKPGTVLVSGNTYKIAREFFEFEPLGKVTIKGKKEPQEAFELIKKGDVDSRIGASIAKGLTRFVGRENSMAGLMEAYEKVQSGSGQVVGIVGEAGVGKSRLLLEMRNRLPLDEYTWLEGRCIHYGGSMAYLPILDILKSYFDIKEGDLEFVIKKKMKEKIIQLDERFKSTLSPFQELLSVKVDNEAYLQLEPAVKKLKTFEAIRDLLICESENKPIVVVVDDLHWMDRTSGEFIQSLIDSLPGSRIMLILLYRPEYIHHWGSKSYYSKIGLDQLGTASSAELVQAILEDGEAVPELRNLVLSKAGGNPLFVEEITHSLMENGFIQRKGQEYVLTRKASEIEVPDT